MIYFYTLFATNSCYSFSDPTGPIKNYLFSLELTLNNGSLRKFNKLDLTDIVQVKRYAEMSDKFDVLIFLVGLAHAKGKGKDLLAFKKINYQTLVNLLSALENNNKIPHKIIFSSTISIYGEKYHQSIFFQ